MFRSHHPPSAECDRALVTLATLGGIMAMLVAVDLALPHPYTAMTLLVAVPSLSGLWSCCVRCAGLIGAATLACAAPLAVLHWESAPVVAVTAPLGIVCTTWVMAVASLRRDRADHVHADLRAVADALQRAMLRPVPRRLGRLDAQVRYLSAAAQARVGGDLYDVVCTPFGTRVIIGDVMGKGLAAVEKAADVLGAFRELAHHEATLAGVAHRLDAYLSSQDPDEGFVTAQLVEIGEGARHIELLTCGHPPPLVLVDGQVTFADALPPAPPLGLMWLVGGWCPSTFLTLVPGQRLLLYTDGVSEARDAAGRFYPLADRVAALNGIDPCHLLDRLEADLCAYAGGRLQDDAAMLLLQLDSTTVPVGHVEGNSAEQNR